MRHRPDLRRRFEAVVQRGIERADREHAEHLARIRALPSLPSESRSRIDELGRRQVAELAAALGERARARPKSRLRGGSRDVVYFVARPFRSQQSAW